MAEKKRLFCVKNTNTKHKLYPMGEKRGDGSIPYYTDDKMFAKGIRDALGGVDKGFHVSHGPDHMGKHGNRIARMRLQPPAKTDE